MTNAPEILSYEEKPALATTGSSGNGSPTPSGTGSTTNQAVSKPAGSFTETAKAPYTFSGT